MSSLHTRLLEDASNTDDTSIRNTQSHTNGTVYPIKKSHTRSGSNHHISTSMTNRIISTGSPSSMIFRSKMNNNNMISSSLRTSQLYNQQQQLSNSYHNPVVW